MDKKSGLPLILKPYISNNLIRLGHNKDGGYIINQEILDKSEVLLTFGLADEFSFEEDFYKYKKDKKIIVYDHSVTKVFWIKHFINSLLHFIHNKKNFLRIFKYFKYRIFFKKKNVYHFVLKVREHNNHNILNSVSLKELIKSNNIDTKETLLKIDIDMDEYRILNDISEFNFLALIIEFTHTDLHLDKIIKFLEDNKKYKIIHLHGNNFDYPDINKNPVHLEITFANQNYIKISDNYVNYSFPVKNLDYPNDTKKPEIPIIFSI
jgi:hypothetical protein